MPYKDKAKRIEYNKNLKIKNRLEYDNLKRRPCVDCGHTFPPYVMEFDHVPERGEKLFNIAVIVGHSKLSAPQLKAELDKCDLVCANCHRVRTHLRKLLDHDVTVSIADFQSACTGSNPADPTIEGELDVHTYRCSTINHKCSNSPR